MSVCIRASFIHPNACCVCKRGREKEVLSLSLLSFLLVCLSVFDYLYHFLTIRKRAFFFFLMCAANDVIIAVKKRGKNKKKHRS